MVNTASQSLETKITGSFSTRFWLELFGNSAHFPIANILLEMLIEGPLEYLRAPDFYTIATAGLLQAYWLTRWQATSPPRRFWGNLIGPALYTLLEVLLEGPRFFSAPHHLAYWGFAFTIGALQALRLRLRLVAHLSAAIIVIENVTRTSILFFMYAIFETHANPMQTASLSAFFGDASHVFIGLLVLFFGLNVGLANLTADRYLGLLRETSARLKTYSEWLLGRDLLEQAFANPSALMLTRRERTILFMDIRDFTRWCEAQSPETVINLLNNYYQVTESIFARHRCIKFKLSADEAIAIFSDADSAIHAGLELRKQISELLSKSHLGVGIGLHSGLVVEGLLGSAGVKFYDVIGDTVNTAKRIESAARSGEILISENVRNGAGQKFHLDSVREINVKGKEKPLIVYSLENEGSG